LKSVDKVKALRVKKQRLEDSDSDALVPSDDEVDYSIGEVEHKGIQEIKFKEESPEVYGSDNFEDSLEDPQPNSAKPQLKKEKSDDFDSLEDSEDHEKDFEKQEKQFQKLTKQKSDSDSDHQGIQEFKIGDQKVDDDVFGEDSEETPKVKTKAKTEIKKDPIKQIKKEPIKETKKDTADAINEREIETIQEFKIGDQQADEEDGFGEDFEETPKVKNKLKDDDKKEPLKEVKKETAKATKNKPVKEIKKDISEEQDERVVETIKEFKIGQEMPSDDEGGFSDDFESESENKKSPSKAPSKNEKVKETPKKVTPKETQKKTPVKEVQKKTPVKEVANDKNKNQNNKTHAKEERKTKKSDSPQRKLPTEKLKSHEKPGKSVQAKTTNQSKFKHDLFTNFKSKT
jgi:hypothetical protein